MFALANSLAKEGKLPPDEWAWWRANNDWYEAAFTDPGTVDARIFDRTHHPYTHCWFKASATPLLSRVDGYLRLLDAHGVEWMELRSIDPGPVVYEDEAQVVVAPVVRAAGADEPRFAGSLESVQLRPANPRDCDFVFNVTELSMRTYVEELFGRWDDAEQRRRSDACCLDPGCRIVMAGSVAAGLLFARQEPSELFLGRIYLMPEFRRSGIGTYLLRQLRERADRQQTPLRLRVLVNNPARRLYERAGFRLTHSTDHHHYFEYQSAWRAASFDARGATAHARPMDST